VTSRLIASREPNALLNPASTQVDFSKARKSKQSQSAAQPSLDLDSQAEPTGPQYSVARIVDEIRQHLSSWRAIPNPADWGVTPSTGRLLTHWWRPKSRERPKLRSIL
jgi:hypothetical protein